MPPAPLRRKRPGPEETQDCDCCADDCGCQDCERCRDEGLQVARDWIPPPAQGNVGRPAAGKPGKAASASTSKPKGKAKASKKGRKGAS